MKKSPRAILDYVLLEYTESLSSYRNAMKLQYCVENKYVELLLRYTIDVIL